MSDQELPVTPGKPIGALCVKKPGGEYESIDYAYAAETGTVRLGRSLEDRERVEIRQGDKWFRFIRLEGRIFKWAYE